jgi:hypothetical protein
MDGQFYRVINQTRFEISATANGRERHAEPRAEQRQCQCATPQRSVNPLAVRGNRALARTNAMRAVHSRSAYWVRTDAAPDASDRFSARDLRLA